MNPSYQRYATHDESEYPELWEGCIGAWAPCLGPSGTRLHDLSGRANWGTLTNMDAATDWVVDGGKYALDFDGSNDFVATTLTIGVVTQLSISAWLRPRSTAARMQITQGTSSSFGIHLEVASDGNFYFWPAFVNDRSLTNWSTFGANWNHFLVIYDGNGATNADRVKLYINAIPQAVTFVGTIQSSTGNFAASTLRIGSAPTGTTFSDGLFGEATIYNKVISLESARLLARQQGIAYTPRRRRKAYFGPSFNSAWARGANQFIQPSMIGVA